MLEEKAACVIQGFWRSIQARKKIQFMLKKMFSKHYDESSGYYCK